MNNKQNKAKTKKTMRDLSQEELKQVNQRVYTKRLGAFVVDWLITSFMINIIMTMTRTLITGEVTSDNYFPNYPGNQGYILAIVALVLCFFYFVCIPLLFGETFGKRWMKIQVVDHNGNKAGFVTRCNRFIAMLIVEPRLYTFSLVFWLLMSMITGLHLNQVFEYATWILTFASFVFMFVTRKGMFHDVIARTKVVVLPTATQATTSKK